MDHPLLSRTPPRLWSEIATITLLIMELIVAVTWYGVLINPPASWALQMVAFGLVIVGSNIIARSINTLHWPIALRRAAFAVWLVVCYLLTLKLLRYLQADLSFVTFLQRSSLAFDLDEPRLATFWHLLITTLLAWRGVAMARRPIDLLVTTASFQFGLILLLFFGMGFAWLNPVQAALTLYLFLFFALITMTVTRMVTLSDVRGGRLPPLTSSWMTGIAFTALAIVGLSILAGWMAGGEVAEMAARIYLIIIAIGTAITLVILSPVFIFIFWLIPRIQAWLQERFGGEGMDYFMQSMNAMSAWQKSAEQWVGNIFSVSKPFIVGLGFLVIIGLILFGLRWKPWKRSQHEAENTAALKLPLNLQLPVANLLRRFNRLPQARRILAAARVRQIYAEMMDLCARLDTPRPRAATPLEFLPKLDEIFAEQSASTVLITQAYLRVRYGELPETLQEIESVEEAWQKIKTTGKQEIADRKRRLMSR
jgi:hypothetical protein